MTIYESIATRTIYPIQPSVIERICIEKEIDIQGEYTVDTLKDSNYRKAVGEYYRYLSTLPSSASENGISFSISDSERLAFAKLANDFSEEIKTIYGYKGSRL